MNVTTLSENQVDSAAATLARAFQDDPGTLYMIADDRQRVDMLPAMFRVMTLHALRHGQAYTTPGLEAVALWLGPSQTAPGDAEMGQAGIGDVAQLWGGEAMGRLGILVGTIEQLHSQLVPGPHRRLFFLGTAPEAQGKGAATALIEAFLYQYNDVPCYLETLTPQNVEFYKKRGFRVAGETDVPESDVHVWGMVRDA